MMYHWAVLSLGMGYHRHPHSAEQHPESRGSQWSGDSAWACDVSSAPSGHRPDSGEQAQCHQPLPGAGARRGEVRVRAALPAHADARLCQPPAGPVLPAAAAEQAGGEWPPRTGCRQCRPSLIGTPVLPGGRLPGVAVGCPGPMLWQCQEKGNLSNARLGRRSHPLWQEQRMKVQALARPGPLGPLWSRSWGAAQGGPAPIWLVCVCLL